MDFAPLFARHKVCVLQFSGGKDSLACLHLLRPFWDRLTVLWCDTGDAFPETHAQMAEIRALVPHFVVAHGDQRGQVAEYGTPLDLVPMWDTPLGRQCDSTRTRRFQTVFGCCQANIWNPLQAATAALGATLVIRGQRLSEAKKSPTRSGAVVNGVEYLFPLEGWSEARVLNFLRDKGVSLPANYGHFNSSADCMTCTAYMHENGGKYRYLREKHPHAAEVVRLRMTDALAAMREEQTAILTSMAA